MLKNALQRFFDVKQHFNKIIYLKQNSNEIKSFRFIYSCSAPLILFSFYPNGENLVSSVQDLNGMRQKEQLMKQDIKGMEPM